MGKTQVKRLAATPDPAKEGIQPDKASVGTLQLSGQNTDMGTTYYGLHMGDRCANRLQD